MIPVSAYLRKHGASKGATTSFFISTPQTGVDSIMISYGLLGPVIAIYRPVVAFISGILGGGMVQVFDSNDNVDEVKSDCKEDCCIESDGKTAIGKIINYAFVRLPLDIVNPLIIGILLSGLISVFIPNDFFIDYGTGFIGMGIMLLLSLPTYICATASVPIAFAVESGSPSSFISIATSAWILKPSDLISSNVSPKFLSK